MYKFELMAKKILWKNSIHVVEIVVLLNLPKIIIGKQTNIVPYFLRGIGKIKISFIRELR